MKVASGVLLRAATGDDLQGVITVGQQTWPVTYGPIAGDDYVAMGLAKWWTADATVPGIRAGRVTVAEYDGEIIGMTSVGPLDGHLALWKLYVLPEFQGSGVGGMLLRAAIARAKADGYDELVLSYLDGNDGARGFYEHYGFTETGREHTGGGVPDSVWLHLKLEENHG
ncbi:GNAT family N-acetyltransferase [Flexivirga caeni]|uniref:GNAT family N-acetyltransferase n=1 Tax=Flexivirga caeni TaxID=2294115 RepID=A0A3M9M798_9MICO|nr:GNAT family N-acetyltransferase [Flexivirga caeni]RNI21366.1 GNAT family N-acetyltransferase [Flexivirga caeni]